MIIKNYAYRVCQWSDVKLEYVGIKAFFNYWYEKKKLVSVELKKMKR